MARPWFSVSRLRQTSYTSYALSDQYHQADGDPNQGYKEYNHVKGEEQHCNKQQEHHFKEGQAKGEEQCQAKVEDQGAEAEETMDAHWLDEFGV